MASLMEVDMRVDAAPGIFASIRSLHRFVLRSRARPLALLAVVAAVVAAPADAAFHLFRIDQVY